jgi:succinate dehydrogenase flavin-adding protein (antitoxin of CptAB toxin-antitoxin module)
MRELDALLLKFVEREAERLDAGEMARFEQILELPDPVLHAYLLQRSAPPDAATDTLLERIRACADAAP